jgi:hypothetical protein
MIIANRRWLFGRTTGNVLVQASGVARYWPGGIAMLAALALAAPAVAQGTVDAHYTAYLSGLPIAKGTWTIDIADDHYNATAKGATWGLLRLFSSGDAVSASRGTLAGDKITGANYSSSVKTKARTDEVEIALNDGAVKDSRVVPPIDNNPERVPLTDAHKRGVVDPMTATLMRFSGNGEMLAPAACQRNLPVFDGRSRYNLQLAYKRMENVHAEKGYAGPAVVCSIIYAPLGGYLPSRAAVKFLIAQKDIEVWLVPVAGTRILVPYRFEVPTPLGHGVVEATQFVSVAQPAKAATKGARAH